jgi:hypothetical protein
MPDLLTLAISESDPTQGKYKIVTMDIRSKSFYDMDLKLDEISKGNNILWDIGGVTSADRLDITYDRNKNYLYHPEGSIKFIKYFNRNELKSIFEKNCISLKKFYEEDIKHSIVKIDYLDDIQPPSYDSRNIFKSYIIVTAQGYTPDKPILNKDLRWINYWEHIYDKKRENDKIKYFKTLINDSIEQDTFLIMYKHNYKNGAGRWIEGFHWL